MEEIAGVWSTTIVSCSSRPQCSDSSKINLLACSLTIRLYQEVDLFYPFSVRTDDPQHVLWGNLLHWENPEVFKEKMKGYNAIEGYHGDENGLYQRVIVQVQHQDFPEGVSAYIYYQIADAEQIARSTFFESGDWLADRRKTPREDIRS